MNDLISRQAAIDALKRAEALTRAFSYHVVIDTIRELPSAQPEQQWIPVTERLPENRDWVLGIFQEGDTGWINPIPFICDYVGKETKATTKECWILKECTDREEHIDYYFNLECVAWMPLPKPPKPYEPQESEDKE